MEDDQGTQPPAGATPPAQTIASIPGAAAPVRKLEVNKLSYHGQMGALYRLWFAQFFLSILTLGIYHFWGKTNLRRYLLGSLELGGDRLEYFGTGKELFLGMLKILPFYFVFAIILGAVQHINPALGGLVVWPFILYFVPVAQYSGFRYRVNRISWRGIRGFMKGSALAYGGKYLGGTLLAIVTLGLKLPAIDLARWEYQVQNARFGNMQYRFKGDPANLRKVNITTLLLAIPTLGFSRVWYAAALQREKMRGLSLGNIRFRFSATGGDLLKFQLANLAILLFTLGFGSPFVMARTMRLYAQVFAVGGDLAGLNAAQAAAGKAGDAEGLLDVLDVDIGLIGA